MRALLCTPLLLAATAALAAPAPPPHTIPPPRELWAINASFASGGLASLDGRRLCTVYYTYKDNEEGHITYIVPPTLACFDTATGVPFFEKTGADIATPGDALLWVDSDLLFTAHSFKDARGRDATVLLAIDANTGVVRYTRANVTGSTDDGPFTDANFVASKSQDLAALRLSADTVGVMVRSTGQLLWSKQFPGSTGFPLGFLAGFCLADATGVLIISSSQAHGSVQAFALSDGAPLWNVTDLGMPLANAGCEFYAGETIVRLSIFVPPAEGQEHNYNFFVAVTGTGPRMRRDTQCAYRVNDTTCATVSDATGGAYYDVATGRSLLAANITVPHWGCPAWPAAFNGSRFLVGGANDKGVTLYDTSSNGGAPTVVWNNPNYFGYGCLVVTPTYIAEPNVGDYQYIRLLSLATGDFCWQIHVSWNDDPSYGYTANHVIVRNVGGVGMRVYPAC